MQTTTQRPAESLDALAANLYLQHRRRMKTLVTLAKLRKEARDEIDRLIMFLDESDVYADQEDDERETDNDDEPSLCGIGSHVDQGFGNDRDLEDDDDREPSLGSPERDRSQENWAQGGKLDLEDEHDGAEPEEDGEPSLGSFDGLMNQERSWQSPGAFADMEMDPSESGIGDFGGLLEQAGTQDWQQGAMA